MFDKQEAVTKRVQETTKQIVRNFESTRKLWNRRMCVRLIVCACLCVCILHIYIYIYIYIIVASSCLGAVAHYPANVGRLTSRHSHRKELLKLIVESDPVVLSAGLATLTACAYCHVLQA